MRVSATEWIASCHGTSCRYSTMLQASPSLPLPKGFRRHSPAARPRVIGVGEKGGVMREGRPAIQQRIIREIETPRPPTAAFDRLRANRRSCEPTFRRRSHQTCPAPCGWWPCDCFFYTHRPLTPTGVISGVGVRSGAAGITVLQLSEPPDTKRPRRKGAPVCSAASCGSTGWTTGKSRTPRQC
jgi:hypothetical protein